LTFFHKNCRSLSTSKALYGLEEFFDEPENWYAREVPHGRSYRIEELRIKSNEDLHKLWFVLLKELNMLRTMEHYAKEEYLTFPNPERIDKVQDSMERLEAVVLERNSAYQLLETGETGKVPGGKTRDCLGRYEYKKFTEFAIPKEENPLVEKYKYIHHPRLDELHKLIDEKKEHEKEDRKKWAKQHICRLMSNFPDMDYEALKKRFPNFDLEELKQRKAARGNHSKNH